MSQKIVQAQTLKAFCQRAYQAVGVPERDALLVADSLVQADLWGHQSHGVMRTFWYVKRIQSGATNISAPPEFVIDRGVVRVLDGNDGLGQVVTERATREAIQTAKQHGAAITSIRNSGHFGTAMYYTRMAALEGCIALLFTNASPAMAPWGGRQKLVGTNPWSLAAPAGAHPPMIMDIATSAVARGKIYLARQRGTSIPEGWAIDSDGRPTIDPVAAIAGNIMPMAGHKGYAISTMLDVLSGVLSASHFGGDVVGPYVPEGKSGAGHLLIVLDIEAFRPLADFNKDMEELIRRIKTAPRSPDTEEIFYPGEIEANTEKKLAPSGIPIPEDTFIDLNKNAAALSIPTLDEKTK